MPTAAEYPLLLGPLLNRGSLVQPTSEIITKTATGYTTLNYAEHQREAFRVGAALLAAGIGEGDVVSSFCWNTAQHYQLYHAVPCISAVLNPLNVR